VADNYGCHVEILASARRHGISDDDIRHAFANALVSVTSVSQPDFTMLVGPDQAANLLEIGVVKDDEIEYVIHAMRARSQYVDAVGKE
jgi:predicted secreted protein